MHPRLSKYVDMGYEAYIKSLPCIVCEAVGVDVHHVYHAGGKAKRNSYLSTPLCRTHHRYYHDKGHKTFEDDLNMNLDWEIINLLSGWAHGNIGDTEDTGVLSEEPKKILSARERIPRLRE